jgi:hypothetical protein
MATRPTELSSIQPEDLSAVSGGFAAGRFAVFGRVANLFRSLENGPATTWVWDAEHNKGHLRFSEPVHTLGDALKEMDRRGGPMPWQDGGHWPTP